MEINQIRYIDAISKYGNFSKAAERLHVTQPTLSQQIKKLEEEIGFPLFTRSTRMVSLTEAGKVFLRYASPVLTAYDTLLSEIDQLRDNRGSTLQFGVLPTFSHLNILETIDQFQSQNLEVSVNIQVQQSNKLIERLLSEQLDVAIANIAPYRIEALNKVFDVHVFSHDSICVLVNSSHPLSSKVVIDLPELINEPLIMLDKDSSIRTQIEYAFKQAGILPTIVYDCPEIYSLIGMLQSGVGISFLSSRVADQYIKPPILSIPLNPNLVTQTAVIYLKKNKKKDILKKLSDFIDSEILS